MGELKLLASPRDACKRSSGDHEVTENEWNAHIDHEMRVMDDFSNSSEDELSFRHLRAVSTGDLFYDLLIVASLATVTARSEIADATSMQVNVLLKSFHETNLKLALRTYICFFTLLWFTWLQSILFEISLPFESRFRYVHKAVSSTVMAAFVACAMTYDITHIATTIQGFKSLSLVLVASRLSLAAQHLMMLLWNNPDYERTVLPSLHTIWSLMTSATAFLSISWGLAEDPRCYMAW